jgi:tetratricopeptide (TPR) repeat protein
MVSEQTKAIEVFYSYAHEDKKLRNKLEKHLSLLKRQGLITDWHDRKIIAGVEWANEINTYLNTAHIILLLISPDFLSSDYCDSVEMKRAMERHDLKEARVIPIILRPVHWQSAPFSKLQILPTDGKAVTLWSNRDKAFLNITEGIEIVVKEFTQNSEVNPQDNDLLPIKSEQLDTFEAEEEYLNDIPQSLTFFGQDATLESNEQDHVDKLQGLLQYFAMHLKLPFEDLLLMAQQYYKSEIEIDTYEGYKELIAQTAKLIENNRPRRALERLTDFNIEQLPTFLNWVFFALRGECFFSLRQYPQAQRDFFAAVNRLPATLPPDQKLDVLIPRLHLAAATRELGQLEAAYTYYEDVYAIMNASTPVHLVAEAHWGMTLVVFERANNTPNESKNGVTQADYAKAQKQIALNHAEYARTLYRAIDEILRVALLDCQIALIEQSLGNLSAARERLQKVLDTWLPTLDLNVLASLQPPANNMQQYRYSLKERANVVSAAACYLASVEHAEQFDDQALLHIQQALDAGKLSYILRRAEAYMLKGQILADRDIEDPEAEKAFRAAIHELEPTDRIAAKIRAHDILGRHLLKQGRDKEGDQELDKARRLANITTTFSAITSAEDFLTS